MGRYYHGDIEGKFWFGVQDSRDPAFFGGKETPIFDYDPDTLETGTEQIGSNFKFVKDDLSDINLGINRCEEALGETKDKIDKFFEGRESYSDNQLAEYLELEGENYMAETRMLLMLYARLELGQKIKDHVEKFGECDFDADFY